MKLKQLFFGILLSTSFLSQAQNAKKEVLFTIDDKPYYTDEFTRVYNKNIDLVKDESQKDLNQYLDLFVGYKLKINKANKLGLQDGSAYQTELKSYRNQLAKNYLTDSKVTQELIEESYKRSLKDIKAAHILFMVDENASPEDTLKAYKKAVEVRNKATKGEDFGTLASQFSEDPSAKENKGELGYFSAFRMVYPFESAAYNTPKGQISKIVRTRFGYHIIKVEDVRENRGELTVAHIMILKPSGENADQSIAKNTIQDIYKKLQQGENFETLAKQFSQDKASSQKGGVISRFGAGQLSSEEFEEAAFSLNNPNEYSAPIESKFGWHIIKLIEKHPVKSSDEMKAELETKISRDERSRLITNSLTEKLKKKYTVKRNDKVFKNISKSIDDKFYTPEWKAPTDTKQFDATLLTIDKKPVSGNEFIGFLEKQQKGENLIKPINKLVDAKYQEFADQKINEYYNSNLESEFSEFAAVMEEYRDGLLLFDLMEKEIWEKAKTDTLGLEKFYETHKANYHWANRVDAIVLSSTNADIVKNGQKLLKEGKTPDFIKEKLNTKDKVNIMSNAGVFEETNQALPKGLDQKKEGVSEIIKDGDYYFVVKINKNLPAGPKTLDETKGKVINDYQQYLEEKWVGDLKQEFKVKVNQSVFEKVKKQIKS